MSNELIPLSEVQNLANAVVRSGLFQAFKTPEQAFVLMCLSQVEGCHPIQAVQRYDVIQGKPAKKTDAMLADFQQRGGTVEWIELGPAAVEASFVSKGSPAGVKVRWDQKRAEQAQLWGKDMWKKFPQNMLRARVVSEGIRLSDPGVVAGLYTPEEVQDFDQPAQSRQPQRREPQRVALDVSAVPASELTPSEATQAQAPEPQPVVEDPKEKNAKVRALVMAIKDAGIAEDERKAWMSIKLNKTVESSKDLSVAELDQLIDMAKSAKAA